LLDGKHCQIDSYKPGTLQEVRLDGPTNLNGVNGAGKTTLLRLIPLFFGESPNRLVPKSRVNESFVQHYLPHDSSYVIFEYRRPRQTCLAVMYASPNEGGLCYRFIDKGFELEDFLVADTDGVQMPISCRDLTRHLGKKGTFCSTQLTARNDYRTVIQNLPHAQGVRDAADDRPPRASAGKAKRNRHQASRPARGQARTGPARW